MIKVYDEIANIDYILEVIDNYQFPVILESQTDDLTLSRYTIISHSPKRVIDHLTLVENDCITSLIEQESQYSNYDHLIFNGGFIGVIRYNFLKQIYNIKLDNDSSLPMIEGGIYDHAIIIDHQLKTTTLFSQSGDVSKLEPLVTFETIPHPNMYEIVNDDNDNKRCATVNKFESNTSYNESISQIKDYIKAGDVYEINYTTGYYGTSDTSAINLFKTMRKSNPSPFGCYFNFAKSSIVSASPELFFKINSNKIYTQPMKGTIKRGTNDIEDNENLQILKNSYKDKIELTMIIDLMRNDISKICKPGSVDVENLFMIKKYQTVFQQVTDVCGILKNDITFKDIMYALFPSGSITGAPKLRSIEVIDELENRARNSYTGAIGFYSKHSSCLSVAIRTLDIVNNNYELNVGGAVVWDSTANGEADECYIKAKALLSALGVDDE